MAANSKDWDRWLPYLMFAYREVPQASTGFSPFELLYGRQVRGPLDLLRDAWESPKSTTTDILTYVMAGEDGGDVQPSPGQSSGHPDPLV